MSGSETTLGSLSGTNRGEVCGTRVNVLAVGPWHEREFTVVKAEFEENTSWTKVADVDEATDCLQAGDLPPELIVLIQSLPGDYCQHEIDRLQLLAPLARIVVVTGTWCEGEMRTGTRLLGVLRLYWYEMVPWWQAALRRLAAGLCPPWSLPLDHPLAGRYVPSVPPTWPSLAGQVAINAADFTVFETLSATLADHEIETVWRRPADATDLTGNFTAGVWDGGQLHERELHRLTKFCRQIRSHGGIVIALLDFPRVEHIAQARGAGATTVMGKPYVVDELIAALL